VLLYVTQSPNFPVLYAIAYGAPAVMLIFLALRYRLGADGKPYWYPEGKLLTAITLYPCVLFLIAATVATTHPGRLQDLTRQAFEQFGDKFAGKLQDDEAEVFRNAIASASRIAPALVSYSWIFVAVLSMLGAQHILRQQKWNLRDSFSIQ